MKLERLFEGKENALYFLDGRALPVAGTTVSAEDFIQHKETASEENALAVTVPWTLIGKDEESYNENFLASFRDELKALEEKNLFALIVPVADCECTTESEKENLTLSMKHCARRIKDCKSVIGFAVPKEADASFFIEELSAKHAHYVFFSDDETILNDKTIVRLSK